jgi:hypothetical protein
MIASDVPTRQSRIESKESSRMSRILVLDPSPDTPPCSTGGSFERRTLSHPFDIPVAEKVDQRLRHALSSLVLQQTLLLASVEARQ